MTNDIWGMLWKKKSNSLTIPAKKTTNSNNNTVQTTTATAQTATAQTATAKPVKVKAPRVKPHKVQHHQAQVQQQAMKPQLSDYRLATTGDSTGVHITVLYGDTPVHRFSLLRTYYQLWQRMTHQQKYDFIRIRTNVNSFGGDATIFHAVVIGTINVLNTLFEQACKHKLIET